MRRPSALKAVFASAVLTICFLLLAEPSLAVDAECSSDSGIPSGVIAPIDVGQLRNSLADAPSVAFISARRLPTPEASNRALRMTAFCGLTCLAICIKRDSGKAFASIPTLIKFTVGVSRQMILAV